MQVGFRRVIGLPGDYSYQWRERQLLVMITAEGPTCVLTIADLQACSLDLHSVLEKYSAQQRPSDEGSQH